MKTQEMRNVVLATLLVVHASQAETGNGANADIARVAATLEQHSQASLAEIVKNGRDDVVRLAALSRLHDQAMLAEIAKNGKGLEVREAAARKLNEDEYKALLDAIAQNSDEDHSTRRKLLKRLNPDMEYDIRIPSVDVGHDGRLPVVLVGRPKPTAEDIFRWEMKMALPYYDVTSEDHRFKTLGQLSKMCDYAVVGKAVSFDKKGILVLDVETVLLGDIQPTGRFFPSRKISIAGEWMMNEVDEKTATLEHFFPYMWNVRKRPKPGDRLLMFLFADPGPGYVLPYHWDPPPRRNERSFDFRKEGNPKRGEYYLGRGELDGGGARYLDTPENTTNYLNAVNAYLRELRGEKRDAESYYSLLRTLVKSPIQSIREDARSDLMYFIEYYPSFDAKRVLSDDHIDEAIKYWVEHDVLPKRENRTETPLQ